MSTGIRTSPFSRGSSKTYRRVFVTKNGPGPYCCYGCGKEMSTLEVVHHLDHREWNHHWKNLVSMHIVCHGRHHSTGVAPSEETRRLLGIASSRAVRTEQWRQRMSDGISAQRQSLTLAARSEIWADKVKLTCECGKQCHAGPMARHTKASGHHAK